MNAKNILIILGIFAIILLLVFLSYKTLVNYQGLLKDGQSPNQDADTAPPGTDQGEEGADTGPAGDLAPRVLMPKANEGKSVIMIVAFKDFQDEEYFVPRQIFQAAGAQVITASNQPGTAKGADGGETMVNILVKNINVADFDAVVFVGGAGAPQHLDNEDSYKVAREAVEQGKILSAICIAPTILAKSGAIKNKTATVWTSPTDKSAVKILEDNGVIYQNEAVIRNGNIITAEGPAAAEDFAMSIVDLLTNI